MKLMANERASQWSKRSITRIVVTGIAPVLFAVLCSVPARGFDLAYSFESDLQGFAGNGPGSTVTLDTIGATDGTNSMKFEIVQPATFVGALTDQLDPFIGDPPGLDRVIFDLTLPEQFPEGEGFFADLGITVFGVTQPDYPGGQLDVQAQFFGNQVPLGDLPAGTHDIFVDLTEAVHPLTFVTSTFDEIFGVEGSGANDIIPTGFQIYINKSSNAPWVGYFDNIRVGNSLDGDYNNNGTVDAPDYTVWRDNLAAGVGQAGDGTTTGDLLGVPDGVVDQSDFDYWVQEFGNVASSGISVPEPSSCLMLISTFLLLSYKQRD